MLTKATQCESKEKLSFFSLAYLQIKVSFFVWEGIFESKAGELSSYPSFQMSLKALFALLLVLFRVVLVWFINSSSYSPCLNLIKTFFTSEFHIRKRFFSLGKVVYCCFVLSPAPASPYSCERQGKSVGNATVSLLMEMFFAFADN